MSEGVAITIRPGSPGDVPTLGPIEAASDALFVAAGHPEFDGGDTIDDTEALEAIGRGDLAVAVDTADDVVVGWVLVGVTGDEPAVLQICVDPDHQQRGIGTELMRWAVDRARRHDADRPRPRSLVLSTQSDIAWNQPWYERLGFRKVDPSEWTAAMHDVTDEQIAAGLDWSTRVHMRLPLR